MACKVIDLLFKAKTPNIDQFDIFLFSIGILREIFELRLQILSTDSPHHTHCHIFLPDFSIWYKSVKTKIFFKYHFEA